MDSLFKIETLAATPKPFDLVYMALHQCYTADRVNSVPEGLDTAAICIDRLLNGNRGHWGCFENPSITLGCYGFPHSVIVQARTHRVGVSFDVQSGRYTGENVLKLAAGNLKSWEVFYTRPPGLYNDRSGKQFEWKESDTIDYYAEAITAACSYAEKIDRGISEELARASLPYEQRQNFILSLNARSLCHMLDLRSKKNAQIEIQWFCELLFNELNNWMPELAQYYQEKRYGKALLSP
jgi:thymidylate synthase (FAD)